MKNFIISNYVLILSIILISIITLIGYFVDKSKNSNNKKEKTLKKELNPIMNNNLNIQNNMVNNNNINQTISNTFDINKSINNVTHNSQNR